MKLASESVGKRQTHIASVGGAKHLARTGVVMSRVNEEKIVPPYQGHKRNSPT
jgi:hypothetical protein